MPNQTKPSPIIQTGDNVAYSQSYIDRQNFQRNDLIYAKGKVTGLHRIAGGVILADVDWDVAGLSKRVYVKDLVKV